MGVMDAVNLASGCHPLQHKNIFIKKIISEIIFIKKSLSLKHIKKSFLLKLILPQKNFL